MYGPHFENHCTGHKKSWFHKKEDFFWGGGGGELLFWSYNPQVSWVKISYADLQAMLKIQYTLPLKQEVIKVFSYWVYEGLRCSLKGCLRARSGLQIMKCTRQWYRPARIWSCHHALIQAEKAAVEAKPWQGLFLPDIEEFIQEQFPLAPGFPLYSSKGCLVLDWPTV